MKILRNKAGTDIEKENQVFSFQIIISKYSLHGNASLFMKFALNHHHTLP